MVGPKQVQGAANFRERAGMFRQLKTVAGAVHAVYADSGFAMASAILAIEACRQRIRSRRQVAR
jgi:alpha-beta hydrolase superfamily lysophospholipase